jgi:hypothetical protein
LHIGIWNKLRCVLFVDSRFHNRKVHDLLPLSCIICKVEWR